MGRTPGATNKTSREKRAEAARLVREAKLKDEIAARDREIAELKKKVKGK